MANESVFIVLDSLSGKAEIQRAGQNVWTFCKENQKIYNNDLFRVLDKSTARLRWPDGSVAYVHQKTQISVNLLPRKPGASLSHTTVLFGAVFFIIKKIVPGELVNDTKVYTPTAVIAIRGTSFLVDVKDGVSSIKMICGTVLVGNIKKNVSRYLGAAFKTVIASGTDPILPSAVLRDDIDSIRQWIPAAVVDYEIEKQRAEAKRDHTILSGKLDERCVVVSFADSSGYKGPWKLSQLIPGAFVNMIKEHHPRMNIAFSDTVNTDLLRDAYQRKTRFIISGTIENFSIDPRAQINVRADEYRESLTGTVKIRLEVTDAKEKKVISEENLVGEVTRKRNDADEWQQLEKVAFGFDDETFKNSLIGTALKEALEQALEKCDLILGF
jgi:hypothetical protein